MTAFTFNRLVKLEGGCNFRDLGGYRTHDGREIKWGRVFRTGVVNYCTPRDLEQLQQLGVRAICDLRRADERERDKTHWPDASTKHLSWDDDGTPPTIGVIAKHHPYTAAGMHATMVEFYRALPAWIAPRMRSMFECIVQGDVPIIVNCQAGKDRTGVAIALLLLALDVPRDVIVEDYLLTNDAVDLVQFIVTQHHARRGETAGDHPLLAMPEDLRHALFKVNPDYLHAALNQIEHDHGNADAFFRNEIGLDDVMRSKLQAALLSEPCPLTGRSY